MDYNKIFELFCKVNKDLGKVLKEVGNKNENSIRK